MKNVAANAGGNAKIPIPMSECMNGAVRYLTCLRNKAALEGGYMVEGNARDLVLKVGKKLKKNLPRERRARRPG